MPGGMANQALMAAGPQAPMGGDPGMGGDPMGGPPPGGEGGMSPQLAEAAQAIMGIQDPAELAVLGQLIMQKSEEMSGGEQGAPPQGGPPMGGPPGAMQGPPPMGM